MTVLMIIVQHVIIGKVALRSPTIVQPLEVILVVKEVSL